MSFLLISLIFIRTFCIGVHADVLDGSAVITHYPSNDISDLQCTAQTQAISYFKDNAPQSGPAKENMKAGMWAAVNANNLGTDGDPQGAYPRCGACVAYKTTVNGDSAFGGPVVIVDQCAECKDDHLDLSNPAWDALDIGPVSKVDRDYSSDWEHSMSASWAFVACDGSDMSEFKNSAS